MVLCLFVLVVIIVQVCCTCEEAGKSNALGVAWFVIGLACGVSGGDCAASVCDWSMSVIVICSV